VAARSIGAGSVKFKRRGVGEETTAGAESAKSGQTAQNSRPLGSDCRQGSSYWCCGGQP